MSGIRGSARLVALLVVGAVAGLAPVARSAAERHARYYTGAAPATLSCTSCHVTGSGGGLRDRLWRDEYRTPQALAVAADGRHVYVTARDSDALLIVDVRQERVVGEIEVGRRPRGITLGAGSRMAYVADEGDGTVSVVDLDERRRLRALPAGVRPMAVGLGADARQLLVSSWASDDVRVLDAVAGTEIRRLPAGSNPGHVVPSLDGRFLLVTNEVSFPAPRGAPPVSEITLLDAVTSRVVRRYRLPDVHLVEGAAFVPGTEWVLAAAIRPKNLLPVLQVARGWTLDNVLIALHLGSGRVLSVVLDDLDAGYADPYGVVVTPDGQRAFVSHAGADVLSVVDVPALLARIEATPRGEEAALAYDLGVAAEVVRGRLRTGANPMGLALSPDGRRLYVADRLSDTLRVVDTASLHTAAVIRLGGSSHETARRRGERLFNSASATFQNQFSCRSCHPNEHVDRLVWDFEADGPGRNLLDNRTLIGLEGTAPFKWNGKNTSLFMQCGIRFARILTRQQPFPPEDLAAVVAFLRSREPWPNPNRGANGVLRAAEERGRALFTERCQACHVPPLYTNRQTADVGSKAETDDVAELDVPHLVNVYASAPYLHDGRARTLEEIWTVFNPDDTHGVTSDMSKGDLNDLIEYLRTL